MVKKICGIYSIQNLVDGKYYVGESINLNSRLSNHRSLLKYGKHRNKHLQAAWNKYGGDNFEFKIIEKCNRDVRFDREVYWVAFYNAFYNGYNMTPGGEDPRFYKDENGNICQTPRHRKFSEQDVLDIIKRLLDGESNTRIAEVYNTSSQIISDIRTHRRWSYLTDGIDFEKSKYEERRTKGKCCCEVDVYSINGEYIDTYSAINLAAQALNCDYRLISSVCYGKRNSTKGYVFRFKGHSFDEFIPKGHVICPVEQYDLQWNHVASYQSQKEVRLLTGIRIDNCIQGKAKSAGGYYWLKSGEQPPVNKNE